MCLLALEMTTGLTLSEPSAFVHIPTDNRDLSIFCPCTLLSESVLLGCKRKNIGEV